MGSGGLPPAYLRPTVTGGSDENGPSANRKIIRDATWANDSSTTISISCSVPSFFPPLPADPSHFSLFYLHLRPIPVPSSDWIHQQAVQLFKRIGARETDFSPSIIPHNQSPTTAAPPTDGTHKALPTVHHDEDYTLCIHAFITSLEGGAYAHDCGLSVSHKWPYPSALHPCYIRFFVILTPFFPPHPIPVAPFVQLCRAVGIVH